MKRKICLIVFFFSVELLKTAGETKRSFSPDLFEFGRGSLDERLSQIHKKYQEVNLRLKQPQIYKCELCDHTTETMARLKTHEKLDHEPESDPDPADIEQKPYDTKIENKIYLCDQCAYTTSSKFSLKKHKDSMHDGERFPCGKCEYVGTRKIYLRNHVKSKHDGIRFPCDICNYQALEEYTLKRHKERKHGTEQFFCDQCEYSSTNMQDLKLHIGSRHENEKYPCDKCDYVGTLHRYVLKHKQSARRKKILLLC